MDKQYKSCQSCGMPLKRDEKGGGTEADGSKSIKFCSFCYQGGNFTEPNITADEMKTLVDKKMKEMHLPGIFRWMAKRQVPKLERWKT